MISHDSTKPQASSRVGNRVVWSVIPRKKEKIDFAEGTWSVALALVQIAPLVRPDGFWLKIKAKWGPQQAYEWTQWCSSHQPSCHIMPPSPGPWYSKDKGGMHGPKSVMFHKQNIPFYVCSRGRFSEGAEQMQDEPSEWEFLRNSPPLLPRPTCIPPPHS